MRATMASQPVRIGQPTAVARGIVVPLVAALLATALIASGVAAKTGTADVSGAWSVAFVDRLSIPRWVAQDILNITPEGPMTQVICSGTADMTLVQDGASLSGTYVQGTNECVTKGGQVFQDPNIVSFGVEGEVHGASLNLFLDGPALDCDYNLVISGVGQGSALTLSGGGPCIVPGHPKSEIPLDPPPAGTSHTMSFEAWRP